MITASNPAIEWACSNERMPLDAWEIVRQLVFQRDGYVCRICGKRTTVLHCDHIVPISRGGTNSPYNLQTLCPRCNMRKRAHYSGFVVKADGWRLWHQLIAAEPRLIYLFDKARRVQDDHATKSFCANRVWYESIKPTVCELVGDARKGHALLGTSDAYDVAYEVIYNVLPDCRNCLCC